jgi:hypothetical protein
MSSLNRRLQRLEGRAAARVVDKSLLTIAQWMEWRELLPPTDAPDYWTRYAEGYLHWTPAPEDVARTRRTRAQADEALTLGELWPTV